MKIIVSVPELSSRAIAYIQAHPEHWDQENFYNRLKNKSCWAGICDRMISPDAAKGVHTFLINDVQSIMGLTDEQWSDMISVDNTVDDLKYYHKRYLAGKVDRRVAIEANFTW